jgi:hypothetical protein
MRPGPGRPKQQLDASTVLTAAAAAEGEESAAPAVKRGKYNNW